MFDQDIRIEKGIQVIDLQSWRDFIPLVEEIRDDSLVYRGQADAKWKVESTLDRLENRFSKTPNTSGSIPIAFDCPPSTRDRHLNAFKETVRGKRGNNPGELSLNEWWALAQTHGLATPLEVVPGVVEIENGGSSGPGGVAWTTFHHERRNRHEKKVHETRQCWQGFQETTAKEAGWGESDGSVGPGSGGTGGDDAGLADRASPPRWA